MDKLIVTPACIVCLALAAARPLQAGAPATADSPRAASGIEFNCGFQGPDYWLEEIRKGVARGEIADPSARILPELPPPAAQVAGSAPCLTGEHIFPYEDTNQILLTVLANFGPC